MMIETSVNKPQQVKFTTPTATASDSNTDSSTSSSSDSDTSFIENSDDSVRDPDYSLPTLKPVTTILSDDSDSTILPALDTSISTNMNNDLPSTSHNTPTNNEDVVEKPKTTRKRVANPNNWKQNKAKLLRNSGLAYTTKKNKEHRAKTLKPRCTQKCRLKCAEKITEEERVTIFQEYWQLGDINRQRDMIHKNMTTVNREYRYTTTEKGRKLNKAFYFRVNEERIKVCKKNFMDTLDINHRVIQTVDEKKTTVDTIVEDKKGHHGNHRKLATEIKDAVRQHINSIPRIESHYLRRQTTREFIDGGKTIADLHNDYKENCIKNGKPFVNYVMYSKIFNNEFNIGFFAPKKDRCELCVAYENAEGEEKSKLQEKYLKHLMEKDLSREEKDNDKKSADSVVLVYDLQAVQQLPKGDVSVFYYKSKLNCLNFTITDLKSKKTECYFWHEGDGNRGSDEIGSCVLKYIEILLTNYDKDSKLDVIFYSDNCCGQNKNRFMIALYLYCVMKFEKLNSITHKFLISGHTQNEGDAVHSVIEKSISRSLKSGPIYVPSQYAQIKKNAKKTGESYHVNEMTYCDFTSLKKLTAALKVSLTNFKVTDAKIIKVMSDNPDILYYKNSYSDDDYSQTSLWRKRPALPVLTNAYTRPIPLGERKRLI